MVGITHPALSRCTQVSKTPILPLRYSLVTPVRPYARGLGAA